MRPRIDLHTHSTASDGTDTPAELVGKAAAAGLDVVALTDHDTTAGWSEATDALPAGLTLLPGIELSAAATEVSGAAETQIPLHLLGYLPDATHPGLVAACEEIRVSRVTRARRMVDAMVADGLPVTWESVVARASGTVGRPHLARELLARGLVDRVEDAFTHAWIGQGGRYYRAERKVPVLQAIALVRAAGGVPVFAHPGAHARGAVVADTTIEQMCAAGLAGLEVDHPDQDERTRRHLRGIAAELGLFVTGSSDHHGERRGTHLGTFTTAPEVYERIVDAATGATPRTG